MLRMVLLKALEPARQSTVDSRLEGRFKILDDIQQQPFLSFFLSFICTKKKFKVAVEPIRTGDKENPI